jgi:DNA-binding transcriptional regulator YiaG
MDLPGRCHVIGTGPLVLPLRLIRKGSQSWKDERVEMSEVIRERRTAIGMSQRDLAKAAGVDVRQIRRYEAGEQQPADIPIWLHTQP